MLAQEQEPTQETDFFQRKPLKEEVFEYLHKRIIAGKYAPGEWLRQEEISSRLGVSQTPVREALDLLVSAGLAERVPYRGVRVLQLTTEEIVDSYAVRLLLESAAARAAALNRTEAQIRLLADIVEQTKALVTLNDMSQQRQLNREFHRSLVAASGNSLLTRLYEMVSNQFPDWMLYEYMFRHPELLQPSLAKEYQEHKAIVDAVAVGDAGLAAQYAVEHIRNLGGELITFLRIPKTLLDATEEQLRPLLTGS
ncbi:MAG: GntR family transcriptional regulator [Anaerolineales bacterium]|nr:GntR family transcriptional regulator [Anaerolineales bacterium]MDP3183804.1 GntR family transcriptional regulator [Anaerolineales bacterium]